MDQPIDTPSELPSELLAELRCLRLQAVPPEAEHAQYAKIEEALNHLEELVGTRTRELQSANRELERFNQRLQASESRLRAINDAALNAIVMVDAAGNVVHWNPAAERIFGYAAAEVLGKNVHATLAPERYQAAAAAGWTRFSRTGRGTAVGTTLELQARRKDATVFPIELSLAGLQVEGRWCAVAVIRDITDRQAAEQRRCRLVQHLEGLGRLHERLLQPGVLKDKCQQITDAAVGLLGLDFCRIWLVRPADICSEGCIHAETLEGPNACRLRERCLHLVCSSGRYTHIDGDHRRVPLGAFKIGRIATGEERKFLTNDVANDPGIGNPQWAKSLGLASFAGCKIRDGEGNPIGVLAAFSRHRLQEEEDAFLANLTETVSEVVAGCTAEEALRQSRVAAEAANRAKSEFLANMSHEIRTPMTAILGYVDVLGDATTSAEQHEAIRVVRRNAEYLLDLINDILDLSKIEAGRLVVTPSRFSPMKMVAEVVSLMRVRAGVKSLSLVVECDSPIPEQVESDPVRLRQILINLVGNAIKFTRQGGIRLRAAFVGAETGDARLRFQVIDSGIGMSEDQMARLFQPFVQADASLTRRFGGTGLGLAISRRLAALLGGSIAVHSDPGRGSVFTLEIPVVPLPGTAALNASAEDIPEAAQDKAPLPQLPPATRVLLAEDNLDNQRLLSLVLRKAGTEVTVVENGQLALDQVLAWREQGLAPDIILMDMQMPVMDGYEATRKLREAGFRGVIVALTAHAMSEDRQKCLAAGCDEYLSKPIDRSHLLSVVSQVASRVAADQHVARG